MSANLEDLTQRALQIKNIYDEQSKKAQGKTWTAQDFAQGFVGDVGDLQKLVMAKAGLRN